MHRALLLLFLAGCSSSATSVRPASSAASSAGAGATCEAWAACGCEMGCAMFEHVPTPAGDQYRSERGVLYARPDASYPLYPTSGEDCAESCPEAPLRTRCELVDGTCSALR